ncbi:MAG: DUF342 domain-containing protein [Oscillospiraceae bacterium]|jgi:uncharacterized protein (DUF342 family)|nr:DUF342 domain-containing protein [Oscillospiraceae bacterium]
MSLKDKLADFLFRQKPEQAPREEVPAEQAPAVESAQEPAAGEFNPALLELPSEHPLYRLYHMRRQESGYLPTPRICLDEDGVLPKEIVQRERERLKTLLMSKCSARLREIKGKNKRGKGGKKKEEKEGEEEEQLILDAQPCFFFSADKLYAWGIVFPPVGYGAEVSREMLYQALAAQGILYGVNTHLVDRWAMDREKYLHLFLVATGKPAFDGANGNIVDSFPREAVRSLEVDEFDRVDYTALNLIHNVKQGQEICRLIKPTEGEPGRTVLDTEIPAKCGKSVPLPKGRNTEISEDGTLLIASIAGDVEFTGRSFQVKPVLEIPGNVDFSTGNINFLGDINIRGDVLSGFTVRAMGNIQVAGVVEAGSTVEAGGDLVVVKGILGDGTTIIRAHRSIFSKYIENSTIYVRENLQTDCIINSQIYSDGEVLVVSGRGTIIGGRIWAAKRINALTVGARSECRTSVMLGGLPCTNFEYEIVQRELKMLEMELEKLECQLDSTGKSSLLDKTRMKLSLAELKLKQLESELADIRIETEENNTGRLECGIAYPGTEICFGDEILRLRQEHRKCAASFVRGEIVVT